MTEPFRFVRADEVGFCFKIEPGLEEDQVWCTTVLPLLEGLPANTIDVWQYCVTEMVNNAIDHSEGSGLTVVVQRRPSNTGPKAGDSAMAGYSPMILINARFLRPPSNSP